MTSGGLLERPLPTTPESKSQLWEQTWKRLERFLPDLKEELFPPLPEPDPAVEMEKTEEPVVASTDVDCV